MVENQNINFCKINLMYPFKSAVSHSYFAKLAYALGGAQDIFMVGEK